MTKVLDDQGIRQPKGLEDLRQLQLLDDQGSKRSKHINGFNVLLWSDIYFYL